MPSMKVGEAIRNIRREQGATLEKIALAAETDAANLSRIERGKQGFSEEMITRIAKALKVPVSALYSRVEQGQASYRVERVADAKDSEPAAPESLQPWYSKLEPQNRRLAAEFVRTLLKWQKEGHGRES